MIRDTMSLWSKNLSTFWTRKKKKRSEAKPRKTRTS